MKTRLLLLSLFIYTVSSSQPVDTAKIGSFLRHIESKHQGIGRVAIAQNGKELYSCSFGHTQVPDHYQTNAGYQVGSISKLFTATLIFKLIEKRALSLEEPLSGYFADMPNATKITIGHLLNHTSGLKNYELNKDSLWLVNRQTESDLLAAIRKAGTAFEPGTSMGYSNSGYFLLTKILEKKHKLPYHIILRKEILAPGKLMHTYSYMDHPGHIVKAYRYEGGWKEVKDFSFENVIGVGDLISTPADLNLFITGLFAGKYLAASTLEQMKPLQGKAFGMGLMRIPFYDKISYGHGGDTYGSHSAVSYNPETKLSVAYAVNGERYPTNDIAIGVLSILYGRPYTFPDFIELSPQDLDQYTGVYSSTSFPIKITITRKESALYAQGTAQPVIELKAEGDHVFTFSRAGIKIRFDPLKQVLVLSQNGEHTLQKEKL